MGELLRKEGLYAAQVAKWKEEAEEALSGALSKKRGPKPNLEAKAEKRIAQLERECAALQEYHRFFKPWYESLEEAKETLGKFFEWYNREHRHINLGLLTPEMVHIGKVDEVLASLLKAISKMWHSSRSEKFKNWSM